MRFRLIMNILLHYKKYCGLFGYKVRIVKNTGPRRYDQYLGTVGSVVGFDFYKSGKPIIVRMHDKKEICFSIKEIKKIKY